MYSLILEQLGRIAGTQENPVAAAERRGTTPLDEWPDEPSWTEQIFEEANYFGPN